MIRKFFKEAHALAWTIAGTALVLITLSGETKKWALWISGITLVIHMLGVFLSKEDESS
jgi:hypothetical protein